MFCEYFCCKLLELDYKYMEVKNCYVILKCFEGLVKDGKMNRYLFEFLV